MTKNQSWQSRVKFRLGDGQSVLPEKMAMTNNTSTLAEQFLKHTVLATQLREFVDDHQSAIKSCFVRAIEEGFRGKTPQTTVGEVRRHIALSKDYFPQLLKQQLVGHEVDTATLQSLHALFYKYAEGFEKMLLADKSPAAKKSARR